MKRLGKFSVLFSLTLVLLLSGSVSAFAGNNNRNDRDSRDNDDGNYYQDRAGTTCSGSNWWKRHKECYGNRDKPPIAYIFATKYSIKAGKSVELYLKTKNKIDSCTASGGWTGPKSKDVMEKVTPLVTTTYTITCKNAYGEHTDSTTIYVKGSTTTPPVTPPAPTLNLSADQLSIISGATSTLTWSSTNTNFCLASNAWSGGQSLSSSTVVSPSATSTYTLSCGGLGGTTTSSVIIDVTSTPVPPPPVQNLDHILISEVYYDVGTGKGTEPANEWVEIYNGTGSSVDLSNWFISDGASDFNIIPAGTSIPNNSFLVITAASTTPSFWSNVPMLSMEKSLNGGITNTSDAVFLNNSASTTIDKMSYGANVSGFDPSFPDVVAGHSIKRTSVTVDTNTSGDWEDEEGPTPGNL